MRWSVLALALLVGTASCRREVGPSAGSPKPRTPSDEVVARVGGVPIHHSSLRNEMARTGKPARAALDDLVRFELLASAAAGSSSSASEPEAQEIRRQVLVQALLERDLEPDLAPERIPDSELRAAYDRVKDAYVHPRLVEIALLAVYTGARMKPEPRAKAEAVARALEAHVRRTQVRSPEGFQALARDPVWKEKRVHFTRTWQALDKPFPAAVGAAAATLRGPGEVTPLITDPSGFYLACYVGEAPPRNVPFDEAREELRAKLYERWRAERFLRLTRDLIEAHDVAIYTDRL